MKREKSIESVPKVKVAWLGCFLLLLSGVLGASSAGVLDQSGARQALVSRVKQAKTLRVLFVGNSYSFNVPKQFEKIARAEGKKVVVAQVTRGGWTLAKQAASQKTLDRITKDPGGKWDVVVLQEQSQTPAFVEVQRKQVMDPAAKSLAAVIRKTGAIPVFFLTWGRKDGDKQNAKTYPNDTYEAMQKRLIRGYQNAAEAAGGVFVVPVGEVWSVVRKRHGETQLYAKDGSHPAEAGNYLAACVFYSVFYDALVSRPSSTIEGAAVLAKSAELGRRPF